MTEIPKKAIRVRMAPSPTGPLHIGGARTTLFNWLFARKYGGTFVLRIEDTDKERSEKKYEEELIEGLSWLGLDWDEGPYRQSERTEIYRKYLKELLDKGEAYYCYCTKEELEAQRSAGAAQGLPPKYSGHCRSISSPPAGKKPEVIRFKVPEVKVEFKDLVRGKVSFDASLFGDIVIAKDLESPLYNFAVVVDDALMQISHVIRGEEHLSNTPKQILIQRSLGFTEPVYAHIPLILNPDRSKMSKRFSDTALLQYREKGYLPEALMNFLALLGWHPKDDREVMSAKELVELFEIERVQQAGAIFNEEKLSWLNREHMKTMDDAALARALAPFFEKEGLASDGAFLARLAGALRDRASTLRDFVEYGRLFFSLPDYDAKLLAWKDSSPEEARGALEAVRKALAAAPDAFDKKAFKEEIMRIAGERRGVVLWPLRVALSGQKASPDPFDIADVLGKEESLRRIDLAIKKSSS